MDDEIDMRQVFLPPVGTGRWYEADPGRFHTSLSCAERGNGGDVREVFLEKAVKEGYTACGICAADLDHEFEPADYP